MDKKISLPKGQFIDDTDAEGQGLFPTDDDVEGHLVIGRNQPEDEGVLPTDDDVEGHLVIGRNQPEDFTVLTPPPGIGLNRSPGHGGELHDSGDDDR